MSAAQQIEKNILADLKAYLQTHLANPVVVNKALRSDVYPCIFLSIAMLQERMVRSGIYDASIVVTPATYVADDADGDVLDQLVGDVREHLQIDDLHDQLTAVSSYNSYLHDWVMDSTNPFDDASTRYYEIPVIITLRPSQ